MKGSKRKSIIRETMRREVGVWESGMTIMACIFSFAVLTLYLIQKQLASVTQFENKSGSVRISTVIFLAFPGSNAARSEQP